MILIIDNYDSFTYNLVQYLSEYESDIQVIRNDAIDPADIGDMKPDRIVISPGPCTPSEAGISSEVIRQYGPRIPILGVCLGHQCIGEVYGGKIVRADTIMHGKTSQITHFGNSIFDGIDSPFEATRYHSLVIRRDTVPEDLEVLAKEPDGEIMAIGHRTFPIWGVQFHPESILTDCGKKLLGNFVRQDSRR